MFGFRRITMFILLKLSILLIGGCLFNNTVLAHEVGVSQGKYRLLKASDQTQVQVELFFARQELHNFVKWDTNSEDRLAETELSIDYENLQKAIIDNLMVKTDAGRCPGILNNTSLVKEDGIRLSVEFLCDESINPVSIELNFLANLARGHRHLITTQINNQLNSHHVGYVGKSSFQLYSSNNSIDTNEILDNSNTLSFFGFGLEHILTGYDHLLFLLGLIVITASLRQVFFAVTAFTIAHSITLALSVLGIVAPSSGIIEALIALSIVYVGLENYFANNFDKRWILTFAFGLIHGFGFAGALQDIALSDEQLPWVLLNFNLGVETGQVIIIMLAFPLLIWLRQNLWFKSQGIAILNMSLVLMGSYWFFDRTGWFII